MSPLLLSLENSHVHRVIGDGKKLYIMSFSGTESHDAHINRYVNMADKLRTDFTCVFLCLS
jgi:hypothetical protein